ncbi:MAG: TIR domain-containing protein [Oculatellaceae cyanobacterium bins.114]|nr:TIR domain-containing protein [Oculatellaceae cyanobacterium bins.114]
MSNKIFITYCFEDERIAAEVVQALSKVQGSSLIPYIKQRELSSVGSSTQEWLNDIEEWDHVIVLVSSSFLKLFSQFQQDLDQWILECDRQKILLLPLLVHPCSVSSLMSSIMYADYSQDQLGALEKLQAAFERAAMPGVEPRRSQKSSLARELASQPRLIIAEIASTCLTSSDFQSFLQATNISWSCTGLVQQDIRQFVVDSQEAQVEEFAFWLVQDDLRIEIIQQRLAEVTTTARKGWLSRFI